MKHIPMLSYPSDSRMEGWYYRLDKKWRCTRRRQWRRATKTQRLAVSAPSPTDQP